MVEQPVQAKTRKRSRLYSIRTLIGLTEQITSKAWMAFTEAASVALLANIFLLTLLLIVKGYGFLH